MDLDQIPGLAKAVARAEAQAEARRDFSFTTATVLLAGVECRQLTARHLLILFAARTPFLYGGFREPEHVAQFLWIVSPEFSTDAKTRKAFIERAKKIKYLPAIKAIERYLEEALADFPKASAKKDTGSVLASFVGYLVHLIAKTYGWDDEAILDKPVARLCQYRALILQDIDPAKPVFAASDKVRREFVMRFLKSKAGQRWKAAQAKKAKRQGKRKGMRHE